jgi:anti-sigma-K factor RskA
MDTSFLAAGPISWAQVVALAAFLFALGKGADWVIGKLRAGTKDAVSPLTIDLQAARLDIASLNEKLNVFKIEVARTYVTGDVITRLERRIDDMVTSVRDEMKETRETMLKAIMGRRPD